MTHSRIIAVHPEYTKDTKDTEDSRDPAIIENLMKYQEVAQVLGATTKLRVQTIQDLFQQFQPYIDNSEKSDIRWSMV